ncbi:MAG: hypothetical protein WD768_03060 [Phycisphaeraceae bacterium]
MRNLSISVMILFVGWASCSALAADLFESNVFPDAHKDIFRHPSIIDMDFSPDGKHLVAAYFRTARNRPGTDWIGFVAQWDLSTGKRTIIWNATAPLAFASDNKTIVLTTIEQEQGRRHHPSTVSSTLGLWRIGEKKPMILLKEKVQKDATREAVPAKRAEPPIEKQPNDQPLSAVFVQPRQLITLNRNGKLTLWKFKDEENAEFNSIVLDHVDLGGPLTLLEPWNFHSTPDLQWDAKAKQLTLRFGSIRRGSKSVRTLIWKLDLEKEKAERASDKVSDLREMLLNEHVPLRHGPFAMSADQRWTAETMSDGTIKLREIRNNDEVTERVLRLDDE